MRRVLLVALFVVLTPAGAYAHVAAGPANTVLPTISGTPQEGGTVTADPGQWTGTGTITFGYAWEQCDQAGANCHLLPYQSQQVTGLQIDSVGTLRVVVTATDSTGSASATSAPVAIAGGSVTLTILAPKKGAVIVGASPSVRLVVKAIGTPAQVVVAPDGVFEGTRLTRGANGLWTGVGKLGPQDVGKLSWTVEAIGANGGPPQGHATSYLRRYVQRYITPGGRFGDAGSTLGCNPCRLRDASGDAVGGGADITAVYAAARRGKVTMKIATPNGWARSGAVCFLFEVPKHSQTPGHGGGSVGCFGPKVNNGGLDADVPVVVMHPTATTTEIVMRLAPLRHSVYELGNQHYLLLQLWSSGNGDVTFDVYPGKKLDTFAPRIKLQLVPDR